MRISNVFSRLKSKEPEKMICDGVSQGMGFIMRRVLKNSLHREGYQLIHAVLCAVKDQKQFAIYCFSALSPKRSGSVQIVPAGCPYQNRKNKSCVNVVLNILSPEHATESIKLVDEPNQLPQSVKTKANKIKVKKMAIYKVSEAIKEIRELTSADSTAASRI
uniref:Uncharacterized protein n=1 Tax=Brassica oleracea var. oleracea TaxID=109376 RepID=A0A0D3DDX9_BRAOL